MGKEPVRLLLRVDPRFSRACGQQNFAPTPGPEERHTTATVNGEITCGETSPRRLGLRSSRRPCWRAVVEVAEVAAQATLQAVLQARLRPQLLATTPPRPVASGSI